MLLASKSGYSPNLAGAVNSGTKSRTRPIRNFVWVSSTAGSPPNQKRCNFLCTHVQYLATRLIAQPMDRIGRGANHGRRLDCDLGSLVA